MFSFLLENRTTFIHTFESKMCENTPLKVTVITKMFSISLIAEHLRSFPGNTPGYKSDEEKCWQRVSRLSLSVPISSLIPSLKTTYFHDV